MIVIKKDYNAFKKQSCLRNSNRDFECKAPGRFDIIVNTIYIYLHIIKQLLNGKKSILQVIHIYIYIYMLSLTKIAQQRIGRVSHFHLCHEHSRTYSFPGV